MYEIQLSQHADKVIMQSGVFRIWANEDSKSKNSIGIHLVVKDARYNNNANALIDEDAYKRITNEEAMKIRDALLELFPLDKPKKDVHAYEILVDKNNDGFVVVRKKISVSKDEIAVFKSIEDAHDYVKFLTEEKSK
jgi:hypothetical protein